MSSSFHLDETTNTMKTHDSNSNNNDKSNEDTACWSISVKTVGVATANAASDFVVQVKPTDHVQALYDQIETATGLTANQQRLIYRGRLINGGSPPSRNSTASSGMMKRGGDEETEEEALKIRDIVGLDDGHTIHLVQKQDPQNRDNNEQAGGGGGVLRNGTASANAAGNSATMTSTSSSLLAALLGVSSDTDDNGRGNRASQQQQNSRRRTHYRLSSEDLEVPDPGSMEPVRQGLMTLHTLLPVAQEEQQQPLQSPLEHQRQFYTGQWIDCRDTVNQWLEATIVDILLPQDILHSNPSGRQNAMPQQQRRVRRSPHWHPAQDPIVSATDFEGRRRLLLEPCDTPNQTIIPFSNIEQDDDEEGDMEEDYADFEAAYEEEEEEEEEEDGVDNDEDAPLITPGYRLREDNAGVQLLLVHYNGWPHRWDEWIRSDSERIRPFRVRTRHPQSSTAALPAPMSVFSESPATFIRSPSEPQDRIALLPELARVMASVQTLLAQTTTSAAQAARHIPSRRSQQQQQFVVHFDGGGRGRGNEPVLPWSEELHQYNDVTRSTSATELDANIIGDSEEEEEEEEQQQDAEIQEPQPEELDNAVDEATLRRQLATLAPLLDRLGRTLIDAAPHVAALSASLPEIIRPDDITLGAVSHEENSRNNRVNNNPSTLGGLLSLLNRDRTTSSDTTQAVHQQQQRRRQSAGSSNIAVASLDNASITEDNASITSRSIATTTAPSTPPQQQAPPIPQQFLDPDYADFALGVVNTTRGEVRSGPRRRANDDVAGLLGAYLAAASLASIADDDDDDDENGGIINMTQGGEGGGTQTAAATLGRLLRDRGHGGGIDIHIHAVVTAPAGGQQAIGILSAGNNNNNNHHNHNNNNNNAATGIIGNNNNNNNSTTSATTAFANLFSHGRRNNNTNNNSTHSTPSVNNNDDDGIFAELYSETPDPVNLSVAGAAATWSPISGTSHSTTESASVTTTQQQSSPVGIEESRRSYRPSLDMAHHSLASSSAALLRSSSSRSSMSDTDNRSPSTANHQRRNLLSRFFVRRSTNN